MYDFHRRSTRLQQHDYSSPCAYFLTICTQAKIPLFGDIGNCDMMANAFGQYVTATWLDLPRHFPGVTLDAFVTMPDHFHGIVVIHDIDVGAIHESPLQWERRKMTVSRLVGRFKMNTAKWINQQRKTPGQAVWQRNYHDRVIRNPDELERIRAYVVTNPLRASIRERQPEASGQQIDTSCLITIHL